MITYNQIDQLFGAPLNVVPKPQVPFKIKTWQWVAGGVLLIFAGYGIYTLYQKVKKAEGKKETPEEILRNSRII